MPSTTCSLPAPSGIIYRSFSYAQCFDKVLDSRSRSRKNYKGHSKVSPKISRSFKVTARSPQIHSNQNLDEIRAKESFSRKLDI